MSRAIAPWAVVAALCTLALPARAQQPSPSPSPMPKMSWDLPVWCVRDQKGNGYRLQWVESSPNRGHFLYTEELAEDGQPLARVQECSSPPRPMTIESIQAQRIALVHAIAEAPTGWYRDEQGRVFQITFDMYKRFYVGGGWSPSFRPSPQNLSRARLEMGLISSWIDQENRMRHTIRAIEGSMTLDDLEVQGQLFTYDFNHSSTRPLLRITTFFGEPKRLDSHMDLGFGLRVLGVHMRPHRTKDLTDVEYGEMHVGWSMMQSADLLNHLQLNLGMGLGELVDNSGPNTLEQHYATPQASLDTRLGLDRSGFHTLTAQVYGQIPTYLSGEAKGNTYRRYGSNAAYEVIFLAINDQPLSLRFEGGVDYRTDLPDRAPKLEAHALSGLRFSFWAPAKLDERLPPPQRRGQTPNLAAR